MFYIEPNKSVSLITVIPRIFLFRLRKHTFHNIIHIYEGKLFMVFCLFWSAFTWWSTNLASVTLYIGAAFKKFCVEDEKTDLTGTTVNSFLFLGYTRTLIFFDSFEATNHALEYYLKLDI